MIYTPYSCQISIRFVNDSQQHIFCVVNTKWHKSLSEWIKGERKSQNDVFETFKRNLRKKNCWLVSFTCEPFCLALGSIFYLIVFLKIHTNIYILIKRYVLYIYIYILQFLGSYSHFAYYMYKQNDSFRREADIFKKRKYFIVFNPLYLYCHVSMLLQEGQ